MCIIVCKTEMDLTLVLAVVWKIKGEMRKPAHFKKKSSTSQARGESNLIQVSHHKFLQEGMSTANTRF